LAGAVLALAGASAAAQNIYKLVESDGQVVFTDQLSPQSRLLARYAGGSGTAVVVIEAAPQDGPPPVSQPGSQSSMPQTVTVNAPFLVQTGMTLAPFDEVALALDTETRMSSPRVARIDAVEAARASRSVTAAPANPLHFFSVVLQPGFGKYGGGPRNGNRIMALPGLNWTEAGELTLALLMCAAVACLLLVPAWRVRLFAFGHAHAGGGVPSGSAR
jgi:hypothetical protein